VFSARYGDGTPVADRLTSMVDAVGTTAYAYDQVGQLLSEGGLWPNNGA